MLLFRAFRVSFFVSLFFSVSLSGCKKKSDETENLDVERSGLGGSPGREVCEEDSDCDDSLYCNGKEACQNQFCVSGRPIICEDDIECTVDSCDESSDECRHEAPDADFDGYKDQSCVDDAGAALGDDCDDDDPLSFPGNIEVCDQENRDEDCNPTTIGELDNDRDGYNSASCCNLQSEGELLCGKDCDDKKANVNPEATEACDFLDNNCDGDTDEGVSVSGFADADHDGRGDPETIVESCPGAVGFVNIAGDCNDNDPEVFEGQFEICDEKDNNCDGQIDEKRESAPWFADVDQDTYGDGASSPIFSCFPIAGRVLSKNDCNDQNNLVNPNAIEVCDGLDNNCDGKANFKLPGSNNFEDDDNDGVADIDCGGDDCNDDDARTAAGAEEVCDRVDNDCDGEVDEQTVQNIWYTDEDGDGWGVVLGSAVASCDPVAGRATQFGDCNDGDSAIRPGVAEICDGIDQDCDGLIDEGASAFCQLPNAISTCALGNCQIFTCVSGFQDADNDTKTGCEAVVNPNDLLTTNPCNSDADCNDLDFCTGTETCDAGFCRLGNPINCQDPSTILRGDVELKSGQDLLALQGIEIISGTLTVSESFLTSLVGLESLRVIGGGLQILSNDSLVRLSGSALSNLETVGGGIVIFGNPQLVNVDLPSLTSADFLLIGDNDSLTTVSGYESLTELTRGLLITESEVISKIEGFSKLQRIGGSHGPSEVVCPTVPSGADEQFDLFLGGFHLQELRALTEVDAFDALEEVAGDVCLRKLDALDDFGLSQLRDVGVDLVIASDKLSQIELPALGKVAGKVLVSQINEDESTGLSEIILPVLEEVQDVYLEGEFSRLEKLELPALQSVRDLVVTLDSTGTAPLEIKVDQLEQARFIEIARSGSSGLSELLFPVLKEVDCRLRVKSQRSNAQSEESACEDNCLCIAEGQGSAGSPVLVTEPGSCACIQDSVGETICANESGDGDPTTSICNCDGLGSCMCSASFSADVATDGPVAQVLLPELVSVGIATEVECEPGYKDDFSLSLLNPAGFEFSSTTTASSEIHMPKLKDAATVKVFLENGFSSSSPELAFLDISGGLTTDESPNIESLQIKGNISAANLTKLTGVNDILTFCASGYGAGEDYERIVNGSSTIFNPTPDGCPAAFDCDASKITDIDIQPSSVELASFKMGWNYPSACVPDEDKDIFWEQTTFEDGTPHLHQGGGYGSQQDDNLWGYDHPSAWLRLSEEERSCKSINVIVRLPASSLAYNKESPVTSGFMSSADGTSCSTP